MCPYSNDEAQRCIKVLARASNGLSLKQLARELSWSRREKDRLLDMVDGLVSAGNLRINDGRYFAAEQGGQQVEGTLIVTRRGHAYLSSDGMDDDVFIHRNSINAAMHRDRVLADVERRRGRLEGRVTQVLERGTFTCVGVVHRAGKGCWIEPRDERLPDIIALVDSDASHGELVAVQILEWPRGADDVPKARVISRLSEDGHGADETKILIYDLGLPTEFPESVIREANQSELDIDELLAGYHTDYRHGAFVTIDPQSARDFDDAVWARTNDKGGWRVSVAVADVSLLVPSRSSLDDEAFKRGTSVYLPDRVLPMLPDRLSADLCSLRPNVPRPAMVVEFDVDTAGEISQTTVFEAIIESKKRFSYDAVTDFLEEPIEHDEVDGFEAPLLALRDATRALRATRKAKGYLELEIAEPRVRLTQDGKVEAIETYERHESHLMIEEAMLAANVVIAEFCQSCNEASLYRIHGDPDESKLDAFKVAYEELTNTSMFELSIGTLSDALKTIDDESVRWLLSTLLLRAMMKAEYSVEPRAHYGLGFDSYLHFTSPIRRYPDLIVHRIVRGILRGTRERFVPSLFEVAAQSNRRERLALEAERDVQALYKCLWLESRVGEHFLGFVTHTSPKGCFLKLEGTECDGFLPTDDLVSLKTTSEVPLRIGDRIKVEVVNVSVSRRRVQLGLANELSD